MSRRSAWAAAALLAAVLALPGPAHAFGSGVRVWLPEDVSSYGPAVDRLFYLILWITGVAFVLVQGTLVWFLIRYRRQPGRRAAYTHGNHLVEVVWTAIPAVILVYLAFHSQQVWSQLRGTPPRPDMEIEVTAEQFAWNIRYAGSDGQLDTADDILTINQLHLPVHQTVLVDIKSKDVIHSFFLPQFRIKQDAVPGLTSRVWLNAVKSGHYEIVCAELCGLGHFRMRGFVTLEDDAAFKTWLAEQLAEQNS